MSYRINFFLAHVSLIAVLLIPVCSHATGSGRYSSSHLGAYHSYSSSGSESHSYGYAGRKSTSQGGSTSTKRKSEGNFYSSYVHKSDAQSTKSPSTYVYKSPLVGNSTYFHDRQSSSGLGGGKRTTTAPDNSLIKKKEPSKAAIEEAPHKAAKKPKPPPDPNLIKPEAPTFLPVYH